uniref:B3 domain-containing transcription repressor VAL2 isoform X1 n=1 Tax=Tanacetum cinerariifolium TaxID=118510 RepID=A0A6L2L365_TANCI|nr:B3 domain-containing transcription repressor VAL2 isoform X1 [Tanacetum cinerariifolium]
MANLEFCKKHNMVAFLKKPTGSEGFQEIVYFLNGSHIRAIDNGEQQIIAIVNGKEFTITEASVRIHLQLSDANGEQTPLFPTMMVIQAEEGKGSGHPSEPQPPPSSAQHIHEEQIPTIVSSTHQKTQTSRQALNEDIELPQTSVPIPNVPDKAVYEEWDDSVERATTTSASLDVAQDSDRVLALKTNLRQTKKVYGTAYTKLIMKVKKLEKTVKSNEAKRRTKIVVSDDEEDSKDSSKQGRMIEDIDQDTGITLVTPTKVNSQEDRPEDQLGVLSAAKVLVDAAKKKINTYTRRRRAVSTDSERVSTASKIFGTAKESVSTANVVQEGVKDKELLASETTEDKANPSVTNVDRDDVQAQIQADEELAQKMLEEERERYKMEHFKGKSFFEVKEIFDKVYKQVTSFVPMESDMEKERTKRAGLNLQEESSKRQKTEEGSKSTEEPKADEISQEDLQQMMMIVPVEEVYVEALQNFVDMLKRFDRDDMVRLWDLVKERFSFAKETMASSSMKASSSHSIKTCSNEFSGKRMAVSKPGWKSGDREVDFCDQCFIAFSYNQFCSVYHKTLKGWKTCRSCQKEFHCGCSASSLSYDEINIEIECRGCMSHHAHLNHSDKINDDTTITPSPRANGDTTITPTPRIHDDTITPTLHANVNTTITPTHRANCDTITLTPRAIDDTTITSTPHAIDDTTITPTPCVIDETTITLTPRANDDTNITPTPCLNDYIIITPIVPYHYIPRMTDLQFEEIKRGRVRENSQIVMGFREEGIQDPPEEPKVNLVPLFEKVLTATNTEKKIFPPFNDQESKQIVCQDTEGEDWKFTLKSWTKNEGIMYFLDEFYLYAQVMELSLGDTVTFSRLDPEGKLIIGYRKNSSESPSNHLPRAAIASTSRVRDTRGIVKSYNKSAAKARKKLAMVSKGKAVVKNSLTLYLIHSLMANLKFCEKHNMVAFLKKPTGSEGFQEIVDCLNGSHIRAVDNEEQQIIATVNGKEFTITEASVRRHLQLSDANGEQTPLFPTMMAIQAEEGEGSGHPSKPQPPPSSAQHIHEEQIPTIVSSTHQKTQTSRQALNEDNELPQTSVPIPNVPDKAVYKEWDDSVERATTTAASLDVAHDSSNILKTQSTAMPNVPLPQGIDRVLALKTNLMQTKKVYGTAYTKLIMKVKKLKKTVKSNEARRRTKIVVSDDEEDSEDSSKQGRMIEDIDQDTRITLVTPTKVSSQEDRPKDQLGVLSAAKVLVDAAKKRINTYTRRRRAVSTGSVKDKGKAIMQESEQPKKIKNRVQIQMSLDEELAQKLYEEEQARFNAEQEATFNTEQKELLASETTEDEANPSVTNVDRDDVQAQIQADEELAQKMLEEERERYKMEHFKGKSFYEVKEIFDKVYKQVTSFVPMESDMEKERTKRAGLNLQEESSKRQKTEEGSKSTEEPKADEISQEDLQQMMMIVPVEEVYVEALQNFVDMLKRFDRDDLVKLWDLVKERFSTTEPIDDKEKALWVELKRLFELDNDDIL